MAEMSGFQDLGKAPTRHIPALDGLRGVAIVVVLFYHFTQFEATHGFLFAYATVVKAGWMGVDLFFVLSGFLITGILDNAKGVPHYYRTFFARRVLRIFPLYYLALTLVTFIIPALSKIGEPPPKHAAYLWFYLTNFAQAFSNSWLWDDRTVRISHFWSLAVEEHFYLVWPFVIGLLRRRNAMIACIVCIALAPLIRLAFYLHHLSPTAPYVFTGCRMDALAVGGFIALALRSSWGAELLARRNLIVGILSITGFAIIATFIVSHSPHWHPGPVQMIGYSLNAVFFGCVVLLLATAARDSTVSKLFSAGWLRLIGKYSYGMYVWHAMLSMLILQTAPRLRASGLLPSSLLQQWAQVAVGFAISFILAFLSFHLFEKHFLRLKRFFEYQPAIRRNDTNRATQLSEIGVGQTVLAGERFASSSK